MIASRTSLPLESINTLLVTLTTSLSHVRNRKVLPACSFLPPRVSDASCMRAGWQRENCRAIRSIANTVESYCSLLLFHSSHSTSHIPNCYISPSSDATSCFFYTQITSLNPLANAPTSQSCLCEWFRETLVLRGDVVQMLIPMPGSRTPPQNTRLSSRSISPIANGPARPSRSLPAGCRPTCVMATSP